MIKDKLTLKLINIMILSLLICLSLSTPASAMSFKDVSKDRWSYQSINTLVDLKILNGFPDQTFRPNDPLTRAQSAIMIGKTLNIDTNKPKQHTFTDVTSKTVGHDYIYALTHIGVFDKAKQFNPNQPLTRAQMAKILVQAFDLSGNTNKIFIDVPAYHWAYSYVQTLVATGITSGTSEATFSPDQPVTREQMAVFIDRTLTYLKSRKVPSDPVVKEPQLEQIVIDILNLTNAERQKAGLSNLKIHNEVQTLAMLKAKDLHVNHYFDHISPVYGSPFEMMENAGLAYKTAGENIAAGYPTAEAVVNGWMNSPGHRANILNANYTHIGIGYYKANSGYGTYYVQMFFTPR